MALISQLHRVDGVAMCAAVLLKYNNLLVFMTHPLHWRARREEVGRRVPGEWRTCKGYGMMQGGGVDGVVP